MASSVSSERAFSSAGITISKRRNRLKGIMEKDELLDSAMDVDIEKDGEISWDNLLDDDDGDDDDDDER